MNRYPWRLLVVALVTDWLPGYEDRGEEQEHRRQQSCPIWTVLTHRSGGEPANGRMIRPTSGNALLHHRERTAGAAGGTYRCGLSRMGANVTA